MWLSEGFITVNIDVTDSAVNVMISYVVYFNNGLYACIDVLVLSIHLDCTVVNYYSSQWSLLALHNVFKKIKIFFEKCAVQILAKDVQ